MSTKTVLEEQLSHLQKEIEADEAWIEYIDLQVSETKDQTVSLSARLDEVNARLEELVKVVEDLGNSIYAVRS